MNLVPVGKLLAEGKTKQIFVDPEDPGMVLIRSKDAITAGDGVRRAEMGGKGIYSTQTNANCMALLRSAGISIAYNGRVDDITFRARRLQMLLIELVARRIAFGSFLERFPQMTRGQRFETLRTEFFYKDDSRHDPLMLWNTLERCFELYQAHRPMFGEGSYLAKLPSGALGMPFDYQTLKELQALLEKTFLRIEWALAKLGLVILDLKIEAGLTDEGQMVVGDVIDNDSWRICWEDKLAAVVSGDSTQLLDKQTFRDGSLTMEGLKANYKSVAEWTSQFVEASFGC